MRRTRFQRLWGVKAIEFAEAHNGTVNRFPKGDLPRAEGLTVDEARAYIREGGWPHDIYTDVETFEA